MARSTAEIAGLCATLVPEEDAAFPKILRYLHVPPQWGSIPYN